MSVIGLDVGGANLKAADGAGWAFDQPFPLWRQRDRLASALRELLAAAPPHQTIALTMTGELADCYRDKAEGVAHIVDAAVEASCGATVYVLLTDGSLVTPEAAAARPAAAAASNWVALATFVGQAFFRDGLLLDLGSTTCDVIPIRESRIACAGRTDPERLAEGSLVYTGVRRTPIAALVRSLPWRGQDVPVAAELFATTRDAYLVAGDLPDQVADCDTADGRPATKECAADRLARMICADRACFDAADAMNAALAAERAQRELISTALQKLHPSRPAQIMLAGEGEFLLRRCVNEVYGEAVPTTSLAEQLGPAVSRAACAHAAARLLIASNASIATC